MRARLPTPGAWLRRRPYQSANFAKTPAAALDPALDPCRRIIANEAEFSALTRELGDLEEATHQDAAALAANERRTDANVEAWHALMERLGDTESTSTGGIVAKLERLVDARGGTGHETAIIESAIADLRRPGA